MVSRNICIYIYCLCTIRLLSAIRSSHVGNRDRYLLHLVSRHLFVSHSARISHDGNKKIKIYGRGWVNPAEFQFETHRGDGIPTVTWNAPAEFPIKLMLKCTEFQRPKNAREKLEEVGQLSPGLWGGRRERRRSELLRRANSRREERTAYPGPDTGMQQHYPTALLSGGRLGVADRGLRHGRSVSQSRAAYVLGDRWRTYSEELPRGTAHSHR